MRLSTTLGERKTKSEEKDENRTMFFLFEGVETERLYFEEVISNRVKLGISEELLLKIINRGYDEIGFSHPKKILESLFREMENEQKGKYSVVTICDRVISVLSKKSVINESKESYYCKYLKTEFEGQFGLDDLTIQNIMEKEEFFVKILGTFFDEELNALNVSDTVKSLDINYEKDFDYIR